MEKNIIVKNNNWTAYFRAVLLGIITTMIGVLIFALILKFVVLSDTAVNYINQGIKAISIFVMVNSFSKSINTKLFLHSILLGVLYSIFSFLIFSLISMTFDFSITILTDLAFSVITAIICAILVNMIFHRK